MHCFIVQKFVEHGVRVHKAAGSGGGHVHWSRTVVWTAGTHGKIKPRSVQPVCQSAGLPLRFTITRQRTVRRAGALLHATAKGLSQIASYCHRYLAYVQVYLSATQRVTQLSFSDLDGQTLLYFIQRPSAAVSNALLIWTSFKDPLVSNQSWTWIGFIHGLDWVGLDWIGLGRNFRKKYGLDWIGSKIDWIGLGWIKKIGPMSNSVSNPASYMYRAHPQWALILFQAFGAI